MRLFAIFIFYALLFGSLLVAMLEYFDVLVK